MSLPKVPTRFGLVALLLSLIVLSLFGSLVAADRALAKSDRESVELDARYVALMLEHDLRRKAELLAHPAADPATEFHATWLVDRTGTVIGGSGNTEGIDSSTLAALAQRGATALPREAHAARARQGILIAVPTAVGARDRTVAVGLVLGERLVASLRGSDVPRRYLAIRVAGYPVAIDGSPVPDRTLTVSAALPIAGDRIQVEIAHPPSSGALRTVLWVLGVVGVVVLLVGLARERRHSIQLAGRTAELERLYEEVARSNRMKSEFLANVSHELRTPLNAVVGFVEMLREGVYGELSPRQALPVDRIAASATHLRLLVDRLLDIAKIAAGRLEIHAEPLVLRPFVLNVASEMESLVSERGLGLSIGVGPSLPRIRTDQTHLRQILINLIGNAVKYTPSGGIHVRARLIGNGVAAEPRDERELDIGLPPDAERQWVALQVSDTGVGIARPDWERIFDEFEQVNAGARTDSARRGTGLGLAISRRLARLLGGDLTVASEVGKGSVFTVWLPIDPSDTKSG